MPECAFRMQVRDHEVWVLRDVFHEDGRVETQIMREGDWHRSVEAGPLGEPTLVTKPGWSQHVHVSGIASVAKYA